MKNYLALLAFGLCLLSVKAEAQPGDPVYYTDSDVEKRYASFGVHYDPMFTHRRLFALSNADANAGLEKDDFPADGGYGYNWGGYIDININGNLKLGVGAGQTAIAYRLGNYAYANGTDTTSVDLAINGSYSTFPLRIGFTTHMNDAWDLEIWVPIAYNKLTSYTESTTLNGVAINNDRTDEARKDLFSVAIMVGGAFYFTDDFAITAHAQFRYFTASMIDKPERPTETPYGAGLSLGLRYSL